MKSIFRIRFLTIFAFMLLIAPFYDSCNGNRYFNKCASSDADAVVDTSVVVIDSTHVEINESIQDSVQEQVKDSVIEDKIFITKIYDFIDDNNSESAFEFASFNSVYFEQSFNELFKSLKKGLYENDYKGFFFGLKNFSFLVIVIVTFLSLIYSFTSKIKLIKKFSIINLFLLLITIFCIFLEGLFETISQVKWGYYLFFINQSFLVYLIDKEK